MQLNTIYFIIIYCWKLYLFIIYCFTMTVNYNIAIYCYTVETLYCCNETQYILSVFIYYLLFHNVSQQ